MRSKEHSCQAQSCIHRCPVYPELGAAEPWRARKYCASTCNNSHQNPVELLQRCIAEESIIDRGYGSSPHQQDNAKVVELVAKRCVAWTMIPDDMAYRREQKAGRDVDEIDRENNVILGLCCW